jgi:hypothetical protein
MEKITYEKPIEYIEYEEIVDVSEYELDILQNLIRKYPMEAIKLTRMLKVMSEPLTKS